MFMYTIVPIEAIFSQPDDNFKDNILEIVQYKGIKLEALKQKDGSYEIIRLLSTEPKDYLNPDLQPGIKIKL